MDWALDEARRRGAEELYLTVYTDNHRARRFYERYGFEAVGPLRLHGRQPGRRGHHHAEARCERRRGHPRGERSARSRTASSAGAAACRPASSPASTSATAAATTAQAIDENRRRAIAAVLPGAELATVHQVHSAEVVYVDAAVAAGRAAARRRDGHRPARPAARNPHRRLRAGAVRRSPRRA